MLRKIITAVIFTAILFSSFSFGANAYSVDEEDASIESYYLYNFENDLVMAEKDIDKVISSSSTVKIMTVCVALESDIPMNTFITITQSMISGISGRFMGLRVGDKLTFEDLLYATVCASFNDAAQALALSISPSLDDFVVKMNQKAQALGMSSTVYADVTGIASEENKTTVSDLIKLARYMSQNEEFLKISSTKSHKLSVMATCDYTTISNRSSLLTSYKGIANFNSGSSGENGYSSIHFYSKGSLSFLCIVMNTQATDKDDKTNYAEYYSKKLLSHALEDYSQVSVLKSDKYVTTLPVELSISKDEIKVYPKYDIDLFLPDDIDVEKDLMFDVQIFGDNLTAPLKNGDIVGRIAISRDGKFLTSVDLIVKDDIERNGFLYTLDLIKNFVTGRLFLLIIAFNIIFFSIYLTRKNARFKIRRNARHNRRIKK